MQQVKSSNLDMIVVMFVTLSSPLRPPFRKRGSHVRDTFADDTMLFVNGMQENLYRCENLIKSFFRVSGGKINWHKSKGCGLEASNQSGIHILPFAGCKKKWQPNT